LGMKKYSNHNEKLFILIAVLHLISLIYSSSDVSCPVKFQINCCLFTRTSKLGIQHHLKTDCRHYEPFVSGSATVISTENEYDLEYYKIKTHKSKHLMRLRWVRFKLSGSTPKCFQDSVYIQIGCFWSKIYGPFCGNTLPHDIYAPDGCIILIVRNGKTYNSQIRFISDDISFSDMGKNKSPYCRYRFYAADSGTISTPRWPLVIEQKQLNCIWIIKTTPDKVIHINFMHYDLDSKGTRIQITGRRSKVKSLFSKTLREGDIHFQSVRSEYSFNTENYEVQIEFTFTKYYDDRGFILGWTTSPLSKEQQAQVEAEESSSNKNIRITLPIVASILLIAVICIIIKYRQRKRNSAIIVARNTRNGVTNTQYANDGTDDSGRTVIGRPMNNEDQRIDSGLEMTAVTNDPFEIIGSSRIKLTPEKNSKQQRWLPSAHIS
uniref:CUB domain-containing protein n=1 Tax=Clytia hemisphaerica TaxID=252671 RepID=A0A7M5WQS7_9CNID